MSASKMAAIGTILALVVMVGGCATMEKGPSDEEMIRSMLDAKWAAMKAGDIENIMAGYSDDYTGQNGEGKAEVREFFMGAIDQGYMEELEIDREELEIAVDGDTATAGPVTYTVSMGSGTVDYELRKEDGEWKIVDAFMY